MHDPIDVAFLSKDGQVLNVTRGLKPCERLRCCRAYATLERFSRAGPWLRAGQPLGPQLGLLMPLNEPIIFQDLCEDVDES